MSRSNASLPALFAGNGIRARPPLAHCIDSDAADGAIDEVTVHNYGLDGPAHGPPYVPHQVSTGGR